MANRNKQKGDRAERSVRDHVQKAWPESFRTRAGFNDDLGDVIAETPAGRIVLQVKDVATPVWKTWWAQLASQVTNCRRESAKQVLGGAIVHKARGQGNPGDWRVVMTLDQMIDLVQTLTEKEQP
ncbi:hypothetical protein [Corynebacterium sp. A21]|uniref:hypothetical protein n=1 Tax=Corynebacterium sp. A21 TaxID=3457318 RepID=UPI003FD144CD